jgi:hypothetical protein
MPDLDEQIRELVTGVKPVTAAEVIAAHQSTPADSAIRYRHPRRMRFYAMGAIAMAAAICILVVLLVYGVSSPKPTVITPTRPAGVPASWQRVTFGGLTMYAPGNWPVGTEQSWGACGLNSQPLFKDSSVELDTGAIAVVFHCPSLPPTYSVPPVNGLLVDPGPYGPLPDVSGFTKRLQINGLWIDPASTSYGGMLVLAVHIPGVTRAVAVEIGLAGGGKVAHMILYSMHRAATNLPSPTTSTKVKRTIQWPERVVASTSLVQDLIPTSEGVYWLDVLDQSFTPDVVQPVRYDPTTGQQTKGPSITGSAYGPALAVTGGWVWVVVGRATDVVVEQLNPSSLAIIEKESFVVRDGTAGGAVYPVVTATPGGSLWVSGGEDLWELNPNTGAVETEFDTGNQISSMSTDPTGNLLYTSEPMNSEGGTNVTEYDARTGHELRHTGFESTAPGTVAATTGGVWVSARSGMAGGVVELSSTDLTRIAPPASASRGFGTYEQIMGVSSSISDQTLWLTSTSDLTCADPTTGAVRATESTSVTVSSTVADGSKLYAVASSEGSLDDVVVITPPAACFS